MEAAGATRIDTVQGFRYSMESDPVFCTASHLQSVALADAWGRAVAHCIFSFHGMPDGSLLFYAPPYVSRSASQCPHHNVIVAETVLLPPEDALTL